MSWNSGSNRVKIAKSTYHHRLVALHLHIFSLLQIFSSKTVTMLMVWMVSKWIRRMLLGIKSLWKHVEGMISDEPVMMIGVPLWIRNPSSFGLPMFNSMRCLLLLVRYQAHKDFFSSNIANTNVWKQNQFQIVESITWRC